jgi:hypothetical protein
MSKVIIKGLRKQLKSRTPQQLIHEGVQPQKQPCSQAEGIQSIDTPGNELQQSIMTYLPSSNTNKTRGKKGITNSFNRSIFDTLTIIPLMQAKCITEWSKHYTYLTCDEVTFVG